MSTQKRPATFSDRSGNKHKSTRRTVERPSNAKASNDATSGICGLVEPVNLSGAHDGHAVGARMNDQGALAVPRCSTPDSLPSLDTGSEGTSDHTTLSEDEDIVTVGTPQNGMTVHDAPDHALQPSAAPNMPRRLNAQNLHLQNMINDAMREDGEFDNGKPIVAWDMDKFDGPWSHAKVNSGHGVEWHTASLQMRLAEMEAAILRKT